MRRFWLSVLIVVTFIVAAQSLVGWDSLVYPWLFIDDPVLIVGPVALIGASYVLRALRIYRYFRFDRGFDLCLRLLLQHNVLLNLLPMRAGEIAFPVLMRRYFDVPLERSVPALLWLRALDFHTLTAILVLALGLATSSASVLCVAVAWGASPFLGLLCSRKVTSLLANRKTKAALLIRSIAAAVPNSARRLSEDWFLTVANWLLKLLACGWIIQLFALESFGVSLVGAVAGELAGILPVSGFAGFGTYEAGIVAAMRFFGVTVNDALTGAVNLHLLGLGVSILAAIFALLIPLRDHAGALRPSSRVA
jgi:hypothetical protein